MMMNSYIQSYEKSHLVTADDNGNEIIDGDIMAMCRMIKIVCITEVSNHYE